ncbi:DapH/DapD/GlmU-related protein [Demequina gelatinilytica]|uniref:DapH/DapD/GlmU-related protein n=1 Tax=Demequina gelatinilytica TaxID=1638980 RepID=UPI0007807C6D|nr:DapH/DapD/GlmU-related protein [Demequina gelatinilytica]
MDIDDLLDELNSGRTIPAGSPLHETMHRASQEAQRLTAELNGRYHEPSEVRALMERITGRRIADSVTVFPPFHTDFGKNIALGDGVFLNAGCTFQDQGGVRIGDGSLIGHNAVIATLNHALDPDRRGDMEPAPVVIGRRVWLGSNVTIVPGVTIGDDAVVAAGAVVTRDVPTRSVVAGVPARVVRDSV